MPETSYPYAVGRIKSLENSLIDKAKWARLWEADEAEAIKILSESGYGANAEDKFSLDSLIGAELENVRELIAEIAPQKELTDIFLLPIDAHNLKILLKARITEVNPDKFLMIGGVFAAELLQICVNNSEYSLIEGILGKSLDEMERNVGKLADPKFISVSVDNAIFLHIAYILSNHKNELLKTYFNAQADFTNIISVFRARKLGWDAKMLGEVLLTGGEISFQSLCEALGEQDEQMMKKFAAAVKYDAVKSAVANFAATKTVTGAASIVDSALMGILRDEKSDSFGIGPIACYYMERVNEAKTLRVLFAAKRANMKIPLSELMI